jgi:hypothetical protein
MQIDKTKFLTLVGAISAASVAFVACTVDDDPGGSSGAGGAAGASGGAGTGGRPGAGAGGAAGAGAGAGGAAGAGAGAGGAAGGNGACLGDQGAAAPACSSECEGTSACEGLANFRGGLVPDLVACLNALPTETCSPTTDFVACGVAALDRACPDPTAAAACAEVATECGPQGALDALCVKRFNGLSAEGRTLYRDCLVSSCSEGATALDQAAFDACLVSVVANAGPLFGGRPSATLGAAPCRRAPRRPRPPLGNRRSPPSG